MDVLKAGKYLWNPKFTYMNYKCVIIDDSSVHRLAISLLIKNHPQLDLVGAYNNPYEGIKTIYQENIDLVFLDVLLEDVDSFELLDQIEVPATIIMNSSWNTFSKKALQYDIQHFLDKPIRKQEFDSQIRQVLNVLENKKMTSSIL